MELEVAQEIFAVIGTSLWILLNLSPIPGIFHAWKVKNLEGILLRIISSNWSILFFPVPTSISSCTRIRIIPLKNRLAVICSRKFVFEASVKNCMEKIVQRVLLWESGDLQMDLKSVYFNSSDAACAIFVTSGFIEYSELISFKNGFFLVWIK